LETNTNNHPFGTQLRNRWNHFAGTGAGDTLATLLTIAVMFGAMFSCAFAFVLGSDGLQLILRMH
jgi:hypothetical protein